MNARNGLKQRIKKTVGLIAQKTVTKSKEDTKAQNNQFEAL